MSGPQLYKDASLVLREGRVDSARFCVAARYLPLSFRFLLEVGGPVLFQGGDTHGQGRSEIKSTRPTDRCWCSAKAAPNLHGSVSCISCFPRRFGELSTGYYRIQSASALTTNADSLRVIAPDILWRRSQPRIRSCPVMPSHRGRDESRRSIKMKSGDRERAPATRSVSEREPVYSSSDSSKARKDGVEDELLKRPV